MRVRYDIERHWQRTLHLSGCRLAVRPSPCPLRCLLRLCGSLLFSYAPEQARSASLRKRSHHTLHIYALSGRLCAVFTVYSHSTPIEIHVLKEREYFKSSADMRIQSVFSYSVFVCSFYTRNAIRSPNSWYFNRPDAFRHQITDSLVSPPLAKP